MKYLPGTHSESVFLNAWYQFRRVPNAARQSIGRCSSR